MLRLAGQIHSSWILTSLAISCRDLKKSTLAWLSPLQENDKLRIQMTMFYLVVQNFQHMFKTL